MRKTYASSIDVARLAGVSQSAVSRAFTAGASVSEETRTKVMQAATALGYRPSYIPRIMLTSRSRLVGVAFGGLDNPFYSQMLETLTRDLQRDGYQTLLVHVDGGHSIDAIIPKLTNYRVDAVVTALSVVTEEAAAHCRTLRIPIITFNSMMANDWICSICCDNAGAGRAVADLFLKRGASRFAFVSGGPDNFASGERLHGFRDRLAEAGIRRIAVEHADFRYEGGFQAAQTLLRGRRLPDAIFCANDLMASGALDAIRLRTALRVPEDLLIAGFDDIPSSAWSAYDLTTVAQDGAAMVRHTLDLLGGGASAQAPPPGERIFVPGRLIERGSTARTGS